MEASNGDRRIRASCSRCGRLVKFLPHLPPFTTLADAAASATPVLDVLTRLEESGVSLHSNGARVWTDGLVPADVAAAIRQCNHQLARLIGKGDV
jgi:hypothetical protein